jgi:hypothetical protein
VRSRSGQLRPELGAARLPLILVDSAVDFRGIAAIQDGLKSLAQESHHEESNAFHLVSEPQVEDLLFEVLDGCRLIGKIGIR